MSKKSISLTAEQRQEWASRVKALRVAHGLKQADLAEAADVTRQTISGLESGKTVPQTALLRRVLEVLGVEIDEASFEEQTEQWLAMMGALIEAMPEERRPLAVNAALRVLSDHVKQPARDAIVTEIPFGVGGSAEDASMPIAAGSDRTQADPDEA